MKVYEIKYGNWKWTSKKLVQAETMKEALTKASQSDEYSNAGYFNITLLGDIE